MNESYQNAATQPSHYKDLVPEPIDVIYSWGLNFNLGNAVKYIARAGRKKNTPASGDLEKALYYVNHEIGELRKSVSPEDVDLAVLLEQAATSINDQILKAREKEGVKQNIVDLEYNVPTPEQLARYDAIRANLHNPDALRKVVNEHGNVNGDTPITIHPPVPRGPWKQNNPNWTTDAPHNLPPQINCSTTQETTPGEPE